MIRILVVDDSAVVRQTLSKLLVDAGGFEVAVAADPIVAMMRMAETRPDVIVLDLEMPRMDGLTFLRKIMSEDPTPVVVCSCFSRATGVAAVTALATGAVEIITKPEMGVRDFLEDSAVSIVDAVRAAAKARVGARAPRPTVPARAPRKASRRGRLEPTRRWPLVAVGASTGGTEALARILHAMPADGPCFVIVQHMPAGFTRTFAERLDSECAIEVREATHDATLRPGLALIAPGDKHLRVRGGSCAYRAEVMEGPLVSRHRPSIDALFASVARHAGANAIGVLLTGMGEDGAEGLLAMRHAGARTVAQDESTCVVFGMPKAAIQRQAACEVLPLPRIATWLLAQAHAVTAPPG